MIIYYIIIFIIGALAFLLLVPILIEIDSERDIYQVRIVGVARVNVIFGKPFILIQIHALGLTKTIDPLHLKIKTKKYQEEKPKKAKRISFQKVLRKADAILHTFRVRYFYVNIDTDDYAMNGLLYPFAVLASKPDRQFQINFQRERVLKLKVVNNLERMLLAFIH